jgi:hypothetical protein
LQGIRQLFSVEILGGVAKAQLGRDVLSFRLAVAYRLELFLFAFTRAQGSARLALKEGEDHHWELLIVVGLIVSL